MELNQAERVEGLRAEFLGAFTELPEQPETELSVEERFEAVRAKVESLVVDDHTEKQFPVKTSKAVPVAVVEGPLPHISLRFRYYTGGTTILAQWIHSPDGDYQFAEPADGTNIDTALEFGEVFATEILHTPASFVFDPNSLTRMEQSLAVYAEALDAIEATRPV